MKAPNKVLIELHYLPSIAFFSAICTSDNVVLEAYENYQKQSYRNRCYILTANKATPLIIPIKKKGVYTNIKDIKIDHQQKWINSHWRSIISAYGKSPFFEHYADYFHSTFYKKKVFLWDLNFELLHLCCQLLQWNITFLESQEYVKELPNKELDCRNLVHPKKPHLMKTFFNNFSYTQVFGKIFVGNLSIIDLLFCQGPLASEIIIKSRNN